MAGKNTLEKCIESGTMAYRNGDYPEGAKFFLKALKQSHQVSVDGRQISHVLYNLSLFYLFHHRNRKAETLLERALSLLIDKSGHVQPDALDMILASDIYERLGDIATRVAKLDRAIAMYQVSLLRDETVGRTNDPCVSRKLLKIASIFAVKGRSDEACRYTRLGMEAKARNRSAISDSLPAESPTP